MNNSALGTANAGSLQPGYGVRVRITVGSNNIGSHVLKINANDNRTITESNYNNNAISKTYQYGERVNLAAYSINCDLGDEFATMEPATFDLVVVNQGSLIARNIPVQVALDQQVVGQLTEPSLAPGYGVSYSLEITFSEATLPVEVSLRVDPNNNNDWLMSNNTLSQDYMVDYDIETWAGKWTYANSRNLTIEVLDEVLDYLEPHGIGISHIHSSLTRWNNISPNVNFGRIVEVTSIDPINSLVTFDWYHANDGAAALVEVYKRVGSFTPQIPGSNLGTDPGPYVWAKVMINTRNFHSWTRHNEKIRVLTHEGGHVLGLAHTECDDLSIMHTADGFNTFDIKPHDEHNVKKHYK